MRGLSVTIIDVKWTNIIATQDEPTWFEDYVRVALADIPKPLPPKIQYIGQVTAGWFPTTPGTAHIYAEGGTIDDRKLAEWLVKAQLEGFGIKQARYSLDWDHADKRLIKEADWSDIEAKAKRLIQSGNVQILRNGYNTIVGHVKGDHGDYQTEISRDDPNSQAISLWQCECKWDQFAWQRTRQWKKYEGRVCAHVLATYWLAQTMPLDEEMNPAQPQGGGPPTTPSPFGQAPMGAPGSGMVPPAGAPTAEQPGLPNAQAPMPPPEMAVPGQAPDIMPPYPMEQSLQPAINPVSVPGQKPQTPLNPVQNAGGTFSRTEISRAILEGPATIQRSGRTHIAEETYVNGQMVQLLHENVGEAVGLNGGSPMTISINSIGEVLGTDPTTGLVDVYFAGPAASNGPLEPHGCHCWLWPNEIKLRPDVVPPGPAIKKRR